LGAGGMGVVYQAWDAELDVAVALKVIRTEVSNDPYLAQDVQRRFKRELLLARQVTHNNVVRIYDLGEVDGIKYITMSYVEGVDLATLLQKEGKLPVPRALRMIRGVASGLRAAHRVGVVHRDLKPANIMIDEQDEARIMDFGIARSTSVPQDPRAAAEGEAKLFELRQHAASVTGTMEGGVVGTIEYMAPEQAKGEEVDQRADLYSFGLIMYDMLGGAGRAGRSDSALVELTDRMQHPPPTIKTLNPDVPDALDRIISRCLEPDASRRYASTQDLENALQRLDENGNLLPVLRRVSTLQIIGAALLTVALLVGTWWFSYTPPAPPARPPISILVADFENGTGEEVFQGSLEQALIIAMEGASFITSYPRASANAVRGTVTAEKSLNETASRLVAVKEGVNVVLAGRISKNASGYQLSVRAISPADGQEVAKADAAAATKAEILGAVTDLASTMREQLGDTVDDDSRDAETVTASNLEAIRDYAVGQDFNQRGRHDEAIRQYQAAIKADPRFGRAYSGLATSLFYVGQREEAAKMWAEALKYMDRMTDREKYRTRGTYFLAVTQNYDKAIEEFSTLVRRYPADRVGRNNLAFAYFATQDFAKAREEGRRAVELAPNNAIIRNNAVLYAMYAGDFATASTEADQVIQLDPTFYKAYLAKAVAALADGNEAAALDAYARMAKTDAVGASTANLGLADIAIYMGRWNDAGRLLRDGIVVDRQANNQDALGAKLAALAEVQIEQGQPKAAAATAAEALKSGHGEGIAVPAARALARARDAAGVKSLASEFLSRLQPQQRAYGRLIEGDLALTENRVPDAVDALRESLKQADLWQARFTRGIAYVEAKQYAEALSDLEACEGRRGEAVAAFLDDLPTFRYLATLPYWKARAQEGAGQRAEARQNYDRFLQIRGAGGGALVEDAKKRRAAL
jgi:serine/threonine protein kinase/tetratricopeptide (TPR) repeat protein